MPKGTADLNLGTLARGQGLPLRRPVSFLGLGSTEMAAWRSLSIMGAKVLEVSTEVVRRFLLGHPANYS